MPCLLLTQPPWECEVVWRLKSSSGKGLKFDALVGNFGGNGPKSNGVKRRDFVRVVLDMNIKKLIPSCSFGMARASSAKYFPFSKHGFIDFKRHELSQHFDTKKSSKEHRAKSDRIKLMTKEKTSNRERGTVASISKWML
ncbi:hypothetical protein Tco_0381574 [Tanacetum coccineum]